MCCPVDHIGGKLIIQEVIVEKDKEGKRICYVHGVYNRKPANLADRAFRFFQRLELIEKIAEIADEVFHLFGSLLQRTTSVLVYQSLCNLHHAAHDIEHHLHSFCFLGDLVCFITGRFFKDGAGTPLDGLRSCSRVSHAVGHFFSTAILLSEHQLYSFGRLEKVFKYASAFNALGYGMWTISLIWHRYQGKANAQFHSDLGIHLAGGLFEAIPFTKTVSSLAPYASLINKATAIAGMIHAWCTVQRLMPKDKEIVFVSFVLPKEEDLKKMDSSHHCAHSHHVSL